VPWSIALGVGWPVVLVIGSAIQPSADGDAAEPGALAAFVIAGLALAYLAVLVATAVFAARRDRRAVGWAAVLAVVTVADVVACPASGHHAVGSWWYAQLAITAVMAGVTSVAWSRHRRVVA
jgi:hypothetical protein